MSFSSPGSERTSIYTLSLSKSSIIWSYSSSIIINGYPSGYVILGISGSGSSGILPFYSYFLLSKSSYNYYFFLSNSYYNYYFLLSYIIIFSSITSGGIIYIYSFCGIFSTIFAFLSTILTSYWIYYYIYYYNYSLNFK